MISCSWPQMLSLMGIFNFYLQIAFMKVHGQSMALVLIKINLSECTNHLVAGHPAF